MAMRFIPVSALALVLMACGETGTPNETAPDASDAPAMAADSDAAALAADEAADAAGSQGEDVASAETAAQAAEITQDDGPSPLDRTARDVCMAGDDGFADALPEGAGFASRGADARVHAAWKLEGETGEAVLLTPSLEPDARLAFDGAVADFLRRNMTSGFDRTGLTGAFRARDGRFCVVQTEADAVQALRAATLTAQGVREVSGG